jgi:hypothetical protein
MKEKTPNARSVQLRERLRQLILMRETGPKRMAWHAARARLIWRLHDELRLSEQEGDAASIDSPGGALDQQPGDEAPAGDADPASDCRC